MKTPDLYYYGRPPYTPMQRFRVELSVRRYAQELRNAGKTREADLVEEIAMKVRIGAITL